MVATATNRYCLRHSYDTRFALQIAQEGCDSQCVSTQRESLICRQNIARHVWRLRHTQCFTSLYMASPTATLGRRPLKVGLQLTQVCLPYGASVACTPVHQPCVASIERLPTRRLSNNQKNCLSQKGNKLWVACHGMQFWSAKQLAPLCSPERFTSLAHLPNIAYEPVIRTIEPNNDVS